MTRVRDARWPGALEVLGEVRRTPGVTRAEAARRLGLRSGSATEILARLRGLHLLDEEPAPVFGRGRPTTRLRPHPRGPLVAAVEVRYEDWRCALAGVDGRLETVAIRRHGRGPRAGEQVVRQIAATLRELRREHGHRLRAVSVAVAGAVRDGRLAQAATLEWDAVDLAAILPGDSDAGLPLLIGNDATLAGMAEARSGAGAGAGTVLHLTVEVGLGGVLVVGGRPVTGAHGAGGEYGHLPFGDRAIACPCGAHGCWDTEVDGRALARHLGAPPPEDPRAFAHEVLDRAVGDVAGTRAPGDARGRGRADPGGSTDLADARDPSGRTLATRDPAAAEAVRRVAEALGAGIAGLVNAHDPAVVTLGGLAPRIAAAGQPAFHAAYLSGLMAFRRADPTPLRTASLGPDAALIGAAAAGLDLVLTEDGLTAWAGDVEGG